MSLFSAPGALLTRWLVRPAGVQDQEVGYFHGFIDGVDYVFVDAPCFHAAADNIYGGSRQVRAPHARRTATSVAR